MIISPGTIKICSLREVGHVAHVAEAGADLFGLILAEARRQVTPEIAREIVNEARRVAEGTRAVGVFVNHSIDEINRIADNVGLDIVQLHGWSEERLTGTIERPVLFAIRTEPGTTFELIRSRTEAVRESGARPAGLLVDGFVTGAHGGSGTLADWGLAREIAAAYPTLLAGGLTPGNVADAIDAVGPYGVDVSSGVESDGQKDRAKIIAFVREARAAFASLGRMDTLPFSQSAQPVQRAQSLL